VRPLVEWEEPDGEPVRLAITGVEGVEDLLRRLRRAEELVEMGCDRLNDIEAFRPLRHAGNEAPTDRAGRTFPEGYAPA
jgi:hypothetical protein